MGQEICNSINFIIPHQFVQNKYIQEFVVILLLIIIGCVCVSTQTHTHTHYNYVVIKDLDPTSNAQYYFETKWKEYCYTSQNLISNDMAFIH